MSLAKRGPNPISHANIANFGYWCWQGRRPSLAYGIFSLGGRKYHCADRSKDIVVALPLLVLLHIKFLILRQGSFLRNGWFGVLYWGRGYCRRVGDGKDVP